MAYYTKVLQPDETVRDFARLHWFIYWPAVFFVLIAIALAVVGNWVAVEQPQRRYCFYAAIAIAIIAVLVFIGRWIRRRSTEVVVTDRRVIYKRGLFSRYTAEMNISKIETVDVIQGIGGRVFGYGTVLIRGSGSSIEPLHGIGGPIRLRNAIVVG